MLQYHEKSLRPQETVVEIEALSKEGGFRTGNTCIPVVDLFQYLTKPIQYCKV